MSKPKGKRCFVLLPSGNPHYLTLFDELFSLAIMKAGLAPHRLPHNPIGPIPIDLLIDELDKADAVFADLSQNDVDIWFTLGCAIALKKPLCLVSSRLEFSLPFDIQDLEIIPYPVNPFPSDYRELTQNITEQLLTKLPMTITDPPPQPPPTETPATKPPFIPIASPSSSEELTAHEALALTIIDVKASDKGLSPRDLGLEMKLNECAHLTSHAMSSLKRKNLVERRSVSVTHGNERYFTENLFITRPGEEWLFRNGKRTNSRQLNPTTREMFMASR